MSEPAGLVPCPFVYADGRRCSGYIVRIEGYKADLYWRADAAGWSFGFQPRSHYHLFCSEKGNHAGFRRQDSHAMKFWFDQLPEPVQKLLENTGVCKK